MYNDDFDYSYDEITFVEYLIFELKILTFEEYENKNFKFIFYKSYYSNYKKFCKKNSLVYEKIIFEGSI